MSTVFVSAFGIEKKGGPIDWVNEQKQNKMTYPPGCIHMWPRSRSLHPRHIRGHRKPRCESTAPKWGPRPPPTAHPNRCRPSDTPAHRTSAWSWTWAHSSRSTCSSPFWPPLRCAWVFDPAARLQVHGVNSRIAPVLRSYHLSRLELNQVWKFQIF